MISLLEYKAFVDAAETKTKILFCWATTNKGKPWNHGTLQAQPTLTTQGLYRNSTLFFYRNNNTRSVNNGNRTE